MPSELSSPFSLLLRLFGDDQAARIFSEDSLIERWLVVEAALAGAQGDAGVLNAEEVASVIEATRAVDIDRQALWDQSQVVGYPILPLIRMVDGAAVGPRGLIHVGATTQDIMDCALALQASDAGALLVDRIDQVGQQLARLTEENAQTVMAARTHAQQAVPTTFGAKCAVYLDEFTRHRQRIQLATDHVSVISFFGAGGTSAASGSASVDVRSHLARRLGLNVVDVPWHVSRDRMGALCSATLLASQTCARLAREIVDLSRTEIGEVAEAPDHHRGASSTMPQKQNPILSEAIIGLSVSAATLMPGILRAQEAGHERAAGEWQAEWHLIPQLFTLASSSLLRTAELAERLVVFDDRMKENLSHDDELLMSEAYMIELVPHLGGPSAHDLVYAAVADVRSTGTSLDDAVAKRLPAGLIVNAVRPEDYLGETERICRAAVERWNDAQYGETT